jgi:WD40 repeat protein
MLNMSWTFGSTTAAILHRGSRLLRFRLLTMFVAMSLIAGWLAWKFHREPITPTNVTKLRRLGEIPNDDIFKLVYSPDRTRVALVGWETPVDVREAVTLWPVRTIGADRKLIQFAFSPDGRHVAYCENGTQAEITTLDASQRIVIETKAMQPSIAFSPDGTLLATGGYANEAKLWDVETGQLVHRLDCGPVTGGLTPVFSPDGQVIAVGNRNAESCLFDVATGKRLLSLPKHCSQELAFHPAGQMLAVAYVDGSLGLWDITAGTLIAERQTTAEEIYSLDWSPDGKLLASAGLKGDICVWDERLQPKHALSAPEWTISVKFSPDGTRLITAGGVQARGGARSVTIWGVPPSLSPFY